MDGTDITRLILSNVRPSRHWTALDGTHILFVLFSARCAAVSRTRTSLLWVADAFDTSLVGISFIVTVLSWRELHTRGILRVMVSSFTHIAAGGHSVTFKGKSFKINNKSRKIVNDVSAIVYWSSTSWRKLPWRSKLTFSRSIAGGLSLNMAWRKDQTPVRPWRGVHQ